MPGAWLLLMAQMKEVINQFRVDPCDEYTLPLSILGTEICAILTALDGAAVISLVRARCRFYMLG